MRALLLVVACAGCDVVFRIEEREPPDAAPPRVCTNAEPFTTIALLPLSDAPVSRGGPRLTRDERTLYFHAVEGALVLRVAERGAGETMFGPSRVLAPLPGNPANPTFSDALTYVIFEDLNAGDIYVMQRQGEGFGTPMLVTDKLDATPYIAGNTLWFSSFDRGSAIYSMALTSDGMMAAPPVPHPELDFPNDVVVMPVVSRDGLTIFFGRVPPLGDPDIWVATRDSPDAPFANPTRVDVVNTGASEYPTWISDDNCRLYFTSNRQPSSDYDLYVAER